MEVLESGKVDARLVFVHDVEGCWAGFGVCWERVSFVAPEQHCCG